MKLMGFIIPFSCTFLFAYQTTNDRHIRIKRGELTTFQSTVNEGTPNEITHQVIYTRNGQFVDPGCLDPTCPPLAMGDQPFVNLNPNPSGASLHLQISFDETDNAYMNAERWEVSRLWIAGVADHAGVGNQPAGEYKALIDPEYSTFQNPPTIYDPDLISPQVLQSNQGPPITTNHVSCDIDISWMLGNEEIQRWLILVEVSFVISEYDSANPGRMKGFFYNEESGDYVSVLRVVGDPETCHGFNCDL